VCGSQLKDGSNGRPELEAKSLLEKSPKELGPLRDEARRGRGE
jgi:hypothetical protein